MPYMKYDLISQSPIDGGITISNAQYDTLLTAKLDGKNITVRDGSPFIYSMEKRTVYKLVDNAVEEQEILKEDLNPDGWSNQKPTLQPTQYSTVTKLQIMTALRQLDLWTSLRGYLSADADAWDDWLSASSVDIDYPLVVQMRNAMGWSQEQLQTLFNQINEEV